MIVSLSLHTFFFFFLQQWAEGCKMTSCSQLGHFSLMKRYFVFNGDACVCLEIKECKEISAMFCARGACKVWERQWAYLFQCALGWCWGGLQGETPTQECPRSLYLASAQSLDSVSITQSPSSIPRIKRGHREKPGPALHLIYINIY